MKALLLWIFNAPNLLICYILEHQWVYTQFQGQETTRKCHRCLTRHTPDDDEEFQDRVNLQMQADAIHRGAALPPGPLDEDDPVIRVCRAMKDQREFDYLERQYQLAVGTFDCTKECTDVPDITPWELRGRIAKYLDRPEGEMLEWAEMRVGQVDQMIAFAEKHLKARDLAKFKGVGNGRVK
jgi:hypothetical protein